MLNIHDTNAIITILVLAIGYISSIALIGFAQLHLIALMGDKSVLRKFAPSTVYPYEHFDIFGFIFFITTGFGWSKTLEIKSHEIQGKNRKLRLFIARNAQALTCMLAGIVVLLISFLDFGRNTMHAFLGFTSVASTSDISLIGLLSEHFPQMTSFSLITGVFLSSIIIFCAANATLHIFLSLFKWLYGKATIQFLGIEEAYAAETIASILLFMIYRKQLFVFVIGFIIGTAQLLASLFGIL